MDGKAIHFNFDTSGNLLSDFRIKSDMEIKGIILDTKLYPEKPIITHFHENKNVSVKNTGQGFIVFKTEISDKFEKYTQSPEEMLQMIYDELSDNNFIDEKYKIKVKLVRDKTENKIG